MQPTEIDFIQYLSELADKKLSYSTINAHKTSICQTISAWGDTSLSDNWLISRYMRGILLSNPPNKGNNKITELRTILQRESQNS